MTEGLSVRLSPAVIAASPGALLPAHAAALERRGLHIEPLNLDLAGTGWPSADGTGPRAGEPRPLRVALVDCALLPAAPGAAERVLEWVRDQAAAVILVGPVRPDLEEMVAVAADGWLTPPVTLPALSTTLRSVLAAAATRAELDRVRQELELKTVETRSLYEVGAALSAERDLDRLQSLILQRCRELTSADAGSLYIADERVDPRTGSKKGILRFEVAQNDSLALGYERFEIDISEQSIAGYVALTGQTLNLVDVYELPADAPFHFNRSIDEQTGYRTRSMLVVPLRNHDNDIVGVIQLINRKRSFGARLTDTAAIQREVVPFPTEAEQVLSSFAGQAASALNNRLLLDSIEKLFEGFVSASVKAIEARDPTTSGHSARVAGLTVGVASALNQIAVAPWKDVHFTETELRAIRYAGMLHDFGKIGVREHVLLKAKKLTEEQAAVVRHRFAFARKALEADYTRRELGVLLDRGREAFLRELGPLQSELRDRLRQLDEDLAAILRANEPTVLEEDQASQLTDILLRTYIDPGGMERPLLEPAEFLALSVRRGSLTDAERRHIESHVQQTYDFLALMPWTRQLRDVPLIAWAHHEKLDGTGYPQRLVGAQIPLESRMMAISDIYDALTASDRPYKRAVPPERALDILSDEAREGKLDRDVLDVFIHKRVYELTAPGASGLLVAVTG